MTKQLTIGMIAALALFQSASAQYTGWQLSGSLYILTTPEGANLPATASEANFPLLVRLNKEWFDFSQAKADGSDIRFSIGGKPLAFQIEEWDATAGTASIWVRVPSITGNARQELKMFWGKPDATSESKGKSVFNESNGYLTVMHLSDPVNAVKDEVGTLAPTNFGATACAGIIGKSLNFVYGRPSVVCGENIMNFPQGNSASSTELWFKDNKLPGPWGSRFVCWGREDGGSKLLIGVLSPLHIQAGLDCEGPVALGQWYHVVHTYETNGTQKVYVNGRLSASAVKPLKFITPARMYIGNWYRNWESDCDVDEVRVSKVTRSADWVKLQYENQNRKQTLTGPLVQSGTDFSVSEKKVTVLEGKSATVTAKAGGAQKVYWIVKDCGLETVADVDTFRYTIDAGRVVGNKSFTLQFKAIYANEVRTKEIAVTIEENIPDPIFTLKAPAKWDGRETIEVVAQVSNLKEMQSKGAGDLAYTWTVSGLAVIKEVAPGKLILKRAQNSGTMIVTATVNNGDKPVTQSIQTAVKEPAKDAWIQRVPDKDEKPANNQFYARDDQNEGTLYYNGVLSNTADVVFLKLYANNKRVKTETQKPGADKSYALSAKLKPGLIKYKVEFGTKTGGTETVLNSVTNLVCGDAYIIQGQSNAEATQFGKDPNPIANDWLRSYWRTDGRPGTGWCVALYRAPENKGTVGYWGLELARRLMNESKMPICIINGAVGGSRVDQHQRNPAKHTDQTTIYGRLLSRIEGARLTHGIRAVVWHQGENDQGLQGPDGDYNYKRYQQYFVDLSAAWKDDYPNIQKYYVFQIWPGACGDASACDMLREKQRTLPSLYSNMRIMSTLGIVPGSSAHYEAAGYQKFVDLIAPLMEQDLYGVVPKADITAPNVKRAFFTTAKHDEIALEFSQNMAWNNDSACLFAFDYQRVGHYVSGNVVSGSVSGNVIKLQLSGTSTNQTITYLPIGTWKGARANLLCGSNNIAALTFCNVPIDEPGR